MNAKAHRETLLLRIGGREFGLPIEAVGELVKLGGGQVCPVPGTPDYFMGLISVRGRIIPAVDGARLMGLDGGAAQELVVIKAGDEEIGLTAPAAGMRIVREGISDMSAGEPYADRCCGCLFTGGARVPVLDPQKLFASAAPGGAGRGA